MGKAGSRDGPSLTVEVQGLPIERFRTPDFITRKGLKGAVLGWNGMWALSYEDGTTIAYPDQITARMN